LVGGEGSVEEDDIERALTDADALGLLGGGSVDSDGEGVGAGNVVEVDGDGEAEEVDLGDVRSGAVGGGAAREGEDEGGEGGGEGAAHDG